MSNFSEPPSVLLDYFGRNFAGASFSVRRRVVLGKSPSGDWVLVCCAVEAFPGGVEYLETQSFSYPTLLLVQDWLGSENWLPFLADIQTGHVSFGSVTISRGFGPNWQVERVTLQNFHMTRTGHVVRTRFDDRQPNGAQEPMISIDGPYYPDLDEAARHWLPFPVYHGSSDGRNREIIFLLPETRAYFTEAVSGGGILRLSIAGSEHAQRKLLVKGAYWSGGHIRHFEEGVSNSECRLVVPDEVERLEYVLMDIGGETFDFQYERGRFHSGLIRQREG